jgi:hypothetical protein
MTRVLQTWKLFTIRNTQKGVREQEPLYVAIEDAEHM